MYRIFWLLAWLLALALPLAIAGCMGSPDDGGEPNPVIDAGQGPADSAPPADAGEGVVDSAPAVDAGLDAMGPPLDTDACEHMIDGPGQAVTPAASSEVDAGDVMPGHVRWDGDYFFGPSSYPYGFVDLLVEQPGKIVIYHQYLNIWVQDASGTEQVAESIEPTACATMMQRHTIDLGAGTYKLAYGSFYSPPHLVVLRADDTGH